MVRNINKSGIAPGDTIFGHPADGSNVSMVRGEALRHADPAVEGLLGAASGAISGGLLATAASAGVTWLKHKPATTGKVIIKNITGNHLGYIGGAAAAMAALGSLVRYSRAHNHNVWAERHDRFMERQNRQQTFAERVQQEHNAPDTPHR